jgi:hypothetical protein
VEKKQTKQINVELDKDVAEGTYANLAMIAHSHSEFILDFAKLLPGLQKARVCARMVMTPQNAKALLHTLQTNVQRYEDTHGEIRMPGAGGQQDVGFHFPDTKN